ncbi:unnamed protein product [Miscanthus lutarioriparius]|uniref:Uncharacterized protein n=1 Tax=Miscanthus lutarioriparius TaxID=422564 RepID=A0A811MM93_9POAL|nr:unnamed protein product [Miscanthus lutarioriparius]
MVTSFIESKKAYPIKMDNYFHEYRAEYLANCASEESYATPVHQAGNDDLTLLQWMLAGIVPLDLTHSPTREVA